MKILILDSIGFSHLGWVPRSDSRRFLANSLTAAGIEVAIAEVESAITLEAVLDGLVAETLVWPNAYHVWKTPGAAETTWIADRLEARGIPYVGSPSEALAAMLHKDRCQVRLAAAGIPVPAFAAVHDPDPVTIRDAFEAVQLSWPAVVKPTSTADSKGIALVADFEALVVQVSHILESFGERVVIEDFVSGHDLTVGVLARPKELAAEPRIELLPTWYEFEGRGFDILDHAARQVPWGGPKRMRRVTEAAALEQVETWIPRVVEALGIRDITRIDGRIDRHGQLRIFDVNGMPGLEDPNSVMLHQVMASWAASDSQATLRSLFYCVAASAASRYGLQAPSAVIEGARRALERQVLPIAAAVA